MSTTYVITSLRDIQGLRETECRADADARTLCSCLLEEDKLAEVNIDREGQSILGSIYVGKVKNILKSIDAAFVEIAGGRTCFLPLAQARRPLLTNRTPDGRLLVGDEILVQVQKEAVKTKDPVLTAKLSLCGKYVCVSLEEKGQIRYSHRLSESCRHQIADMLQKIVLPAGVGAVIRTSAQELADFSPLEQELRTLSGQMARILQTGKSRTVFSLLTQRVPDYIRRLQDCGRFPDKIITDRLSVFQTLQAYYQKQDPEKCDAIAFYEDKNLPLSALYGLGGRLAEAFSKHVWLKSGGYLVMEPTEALTVIDVNSGKHTGKKGMEQTFFLINQEAALEVARQLRLRNLSGIIVVDFINMEETKANRNLLCCLREICSRDPVPVRVVDMTALGLVEITRKKRSRPLAEQLKEAGYLFTG